MIDAEGHGGGKVFFREVQKLMTGVCDDDWEKLLQQANERGWVKPRPPRMMPDALEHLTLRITNDLRHPGIIERQVCQVIHEMRAYLGHSQDTRDSGLIAQQFLTRVDQLASMPGGEDMEAVLGRAREDVLEGVPLGYRRKVLERVLDAEEDRLRESGATQEDMDALTSDREARRARGWRAMASSRGRGER